MHRFAPEKSIQIQHGLGADIMFAFDELTTLVDTRRYQEESVERTHRWARRCLVEHDRLTTERTHRPLQSLWGVVQGAQYEDLRRQAARGLVELSAEAEKDGRRGFGGFGIGGALEKENLGTITGWVCDELPDDKPRHMLGISEPDDLFTCIAAGADTFTATVGCEQVTGSVDWNGSGDDATVTFSDMDTRTEGDCGPGDGYLAGKLTDLLENPDLRWRFDDSNSLREFRLWVEDAPENGISFSG